MKKLWKTAFAYLIGTTVFEVALAVLLEATGAKAAGSGILARPMGLIIHTHLLGLGFFFYLLLLMLDKLFDLTRDSGFRRFEIIYNSGLLLSVAVMLYRSLGEIFTYEANKMVAMGIGTVAHIFVAVGLILFALILKRGVQRCEEKQGA